jgi:hypothetical protein
MANRIRALLLLAAIGAAQLPGAEFDRFVQSFARQSGARRVHLPFMGFANFLVSVGKPGGASSFKLAVFERGEIDTPRFSEVADSTAADDSWKPMIRVRSRDGSVTNIYEHEAGKQLELLIATLDSDNATFVHVRLDAKALAKFIDEHANR